MKKKFISIVLLTITIITLLLCTGCSVAPRQVVNLGDFIIIKQSGYDGYGTTEVAIDYEQIINICEAPAVNKENMKAYITQSFYPYKTTTATYEKTSNGQTVTIDFVESSPELITAFKQGLNIEFKTDSTEYTIKDLPLLTEKDFFDMMIVDTFNTISGEGSVEFKTSCVVNDKSIVFDLQHNGENGKLKNGDKVTVSFSDDFDLNAFVLNTGCVPNKMEKEVTIDFLAEYATSDYIFDHLPNEGEKSINQVVEDWVISGANDYSSKDVNKREYSCLGYVFHTNTDSLETVEESTLSAVYSISDETLPEDYFITMSITGVFAFDKNSHISINGEDLPASFVYYDKETVKWEQLTGWEQGSEGQGFLVGEVPYAGHRTSQEAFDFLRAQYGDKYQFVYHNLPVALMEPIQEGELINP